MELKNKEEKFVIVAGLVIMVAGLAAFGLHAWRGGADVHPAVIAVVCLLLYANGFVLYGLRVLGDRIKALERGAA